MRVANTDFPDLALTGGTFGAFDGEGDDVMGEVAGIGVDGVLLVGGGAIAKVPMPTSNVAVTAVVEADSARVGNDAERPITFDGLAELRLQRHEGEESLHRCIAVHLMMLGQIPETIVASSTIVVDDSPTEANILVLVETALHRLLGTFRASIVEGGDIELQLEGATLSVTELVVVGIVGIRQIFQPLLWSPDHCPRLAFGRRSHDMIVLGMDVLKLEKGIDAALHLRIETELVGVRTTRKVGIDHYLVGIVAQTELVEVPKVVVGLIEEIEAIETIHPPYFHLQVERRAIDARMLSCIVPHLVDTNCITVGDDVPIGEVAIDTRNGSTGELEYLETRFAHLNIVLTLGRNTCQQGEYA